MSVATRTYRQRASEINFQERSNGMDRLQFGDALWRRIVRPFFFVMEPERAHHAAVQMLELIGKSEPALNLIRHLYPSPYTDSSCEVGGMRWRNPVGLAAGFTKDGRGLVALDAMGFGCIEIGTIVPQPQQGNPKPRVFRIHDKKEGTLTVVNRYGFNSEGVAAVANRVHNTLLRNTIITPLIYSIGANKDTVGSADRPDYIARVADDYVSAFRTLLPILRTNKFINDGIQINISSPNTPGLRGLFTRLPEFLRLLDMQTRKFARPSGLPFPPLILKLPPDLENEQFAFVIKEAAQYGFSAIEAFNTTISSNVRKQFNIREEGGISGEALRNYAWLKTQTVKRVIKDSGVHLDLIGVGGIMQGHHAIQKGTKAVQVYTGLILRGPRLIHEICAAFRDDMHRERGVL